MVRNFRPFVVMIAILAMVVVVTLTAAYAQFEPPTQSQQRQQVIPPPEQTNQGQQKQVEQPRINTAQVEQIATTAARAEVAKSLKGYSAADHDHYVILGIAIVGTLLAAVAFLWVWHVGSKLKKLENDLPTKKVFKALEERVHALEPPTQEELLKQQLAELDVLIGGLKEQKQEAVDEDTPEGLDRAKALTVQIKELTTQREQLLQDRGLAGDLQSFFSQAARNRKKSEEGSIQIFGCLAVLMISALLVPAVFGQTCWNVVTGKSYGSVKQAIAVAGTNNEFQCATGGKVVEIVGMNGSVLYTPTIKANKPLSFEFVPTGSARAIVKVDGRQVGAMVIYRDTQDAFIAGGAIDLARGHITTSDATARKAAQAADAKAGAAQTAVAKVANDFNTLFGSDGTGGVYGQRMATVEGKLVDVSVPLQAQINQLKTDLASVKADLDATTTRTNQILYGNTAGTGQPVFATKAAVEAIEAKTVELAQGLQLTQDAVGGDKTPQRAFRQSYQERLRGFRAQAQEQRKQAGAARGSNTVRMRPE